MDKIPHILKALVIAAGLSCIGCKTTTTVSLPIELKDFAQVNFPDRHISEWHTISDVRGNHYLLTMEDSTTVKFNEHFKWIDIRTKEGLPVPLSMIHKGIQDYLTTEKINPDNIVRIEKIPRTGYDVTLRNGRHLLFDTKGQLIEQ